MTREEKNTIACAKKELNWYSIFIDKLNDHNVGWEYAIKQLERLGCMVNEDTEDYFEEDERRQVDIFGVFIGFTLVEHKGNLDIGYGWVCDDWNTDLYKHRVGDFRPYYDENSRKEFLER